MFDIKTLLIAIPALPLVATLVTAVFGRRVLRQRSHWPVVAAVAGSFLASLLLLNEVHKAAALEDSNQKVGYESVLALWTWAAVDNAYDLDDETDAQGSQTKDFRIDVTLRADPLSSIMLVAVTLVSLLVVIYSIGYMHDDPGYWRFFTYLGLFIFSMTMLVSVSNFVLLYVFWEAVGLCSYLLIGFWFQKREASAAGKKAFLVNRVGDFGFALGVFLLWTTYGTLDFHDTTTKDDGTVAVAMADDEVTTAGVLGQERLTEGNYKTGAVATAICLLLMLGACGKSAQFPLHVWLPDAMEGPTPVSALIHAATMVTAGVYMVARCSPLFFASTDAQHVVALIGGFTALMAALIALTQTDLKRILAYSTISQLGFMFLALGTGTLVGVVAAMFHLFTHAFFKGLLFLGAGSVMHAMGGVIDVRRFGGLRRLMPVTHWTFLFGSLALAGIIPFAGFYSKDTILLAVHAKEGAFYAVLYWTAVVTALLTAFYTFRAFFLTFYGDEQIPPEAGHHAHESPGAMVWPLRILAVASLLAGIVLYQWGSFDGFIRKTPSLDYLARQADLAAAEDAVAGHESVEHDAHFAVMAQSIVIAFLGVGLAAFFYLGDRKEIAAIARAMDRAGLYRLSHGKFYFDTIYKFLVVWPLEGIARLCYWIDRYVIDAAVDFCGMVPRALGASLRPLQSGLIQFYALAMVLGLLILIGSLLMCTL
ncbi:MAG: NADH-quinone oxidoreductase subunit L [Planctomycetes bacterium]|nr:NADH-quinone oxidoreductase subunit L [Planctomycetota bacterium]